MKSCGPKKKYVAGGAVSSAQHRKAIKVAATGRPKGGMTPGEANSKLAADKRAERFTYAGRKK